MVCSSRAAAWMMFVASASSVAALESGSSPTGATFWRWPYTNSPHVIGNNPRDGLPDFDYFDADNSSLTPATIQCPSELIASCSADQGKKSDESCGSDKLNLCNGGVYCDISHHNIKNMNLTEEYMPDFVGDAAPVLNRTRRNILQRAVGWLAVHAPYFGCKIPMFKHDGLEMCASDDNAKCPQYAYTLTCEGLISMAWGSPGYGGGTPKALQISHLDLLPGDSIPIQKSVNGTVKGINHYLMFREWVEGEEGTSARVYQMGGGHGSTNMVTMSQIKWCKDPTEDHASDKEEPWVEESLHLEMESAAAAEQVEEGKLGSHGTSYCHKARRYGALVDE